MVSTRTNWLVPVVLPRDTHTAHGRRAILTWRALLGVGRLRSRPRRPKSPIRMLPIPLITEGSTRVHFSAVRAGRVTRKIMTLLMFPPCTLLPPRAVLIRPRGGRPPSSPPTLFTRVFASGINIRFLQTWQGGPETKGVGPIRLFLRVSSLSPMLSATGRSELLPFPWWTFSATALFGPVELWNRKPVEMGFRVGLPTKFPSLRGTLPMSLIMLLGCILVPQKELQIGSPIMQKLLLALGRFRNPWKMGLASLAIRALLVGKLAQPLVWVRLRNWETTARAMVSIPRVEGL